MSAIDDWKRKQSTPAQPGAPMGGAQTPRLDAMKAKGSLRDEIDSRMAKPDPKRVDEQMKALKEAVPAWVKDGLGLKGREARHVEKVAKEFAKKEGRLPTVTEIEQSIPDFIELPKQVPSDDAAASPKQPFQLSVVNTATGDTPIWKIRFQASTLAGGTAEELGFVEGFMDLAPSAGSVYGKVTIDGTTGVITGRSIEPIGAFPANTTTAFHVYIGSVWKDADNNWQVGNSRYGPIDAYVCRLWYRATAPFYAVYWQ